MRIVFGCGYFPLVSSNMTSLNVRLRLVGPRRADEPGRDAEPIYREIEADTSPAPAQAARPARRAVPWPLPVALRLPYR